MALAGAVLLAVAVAAGMRLLVQWLADIRRKAKVSASIPGPPPLPILGNYFDLRKGRVWDIFHAWVQEYGTLFRLWIGPKLLVLVLDAKDAETVLSSPACYSKPSGGYSVASIFIGKGLVVLNGPAHRQHRKLILPTMHREVVEPFHPIMDDVAKEMVDAMRPMADTGEVFDAAPLCGLASVNSTFRTTLSADNDVFDSLLEERRLIATKANRMSFVLMYRVMRPWLYPDATFWFTQHHEEFYSMAAIFDKLILTVMDSKAGATAAPPAAAGVPEGAPAPRRRQAFLEHLLSLDEARSLTRDELFEEVKTMLSASAVTSMEALSTQLLLLSVLPDVQAKIHDELDEVFGASDRPQDLADLDHLPYLERFVKEGLRYAPPFASMARQSSADVPLPSGHTIPAGTLILLSPLGTHRNPEYYPDPERFDPDRFLPEAVAARPTCSFLPFSAGPRNCIGMRYAMMFLKTSLATILRHYTVLPDPKSPADVADIRMSFGLTYFPRYGCHIRIRKRRPEVRV